MSRSYRKPIWTEGYGGKWRKFAKRKANKSVRQNKIPNGKAYKKFFNSWDICDFKFVEYDPAKIRKVKCK